METFTRFMKNHLFVIFLTVLELTLFAANFKPGTFFVGWDNLLPELNFAANFERSLFGVWQEYRGLGFLDGMSFNANFIHYLFIFLLDIFLPTNTLRYIFIFLMHLLGGIGMFYLLKRKIVFSALISFVGAWFYMLNLATIQIFYAPYELFLVNFAFLPFLINSLLDLLEEVSSKNIATFSLLTFLSTPQFHVPTLFIVYILLLITILLYKIYLYKKTILKRSILALSLVFIFNSFWLLPFIYSSLNRSSVIINSKINQLTNEDVFAKNKQRGGLLDVLYLKGYMLDEVEMQKDQRIEHIMGQWRNYLESAQFKIISTIFLEIILFGLIAALFIRNKTLIPFIFVLLICFVFLVTNTPIFGNLTDFLRDNSSLFREIFRFNFTKFSIMYVFCMTIFFSYGIKTAVEFLKIFFRSNKPLYVIPISLTLGILIYSWPAFQGYFLYDALRVRVPDEYFQTIEYFKSQDKNSRIAAFPMPTFWNWKFYNFGARGSGFIWFGIPQAITDRAFDPWSSENENYFWEMSYAIYSKDVSLIEKLVEKYQLSFLLLDKNIINPLSPKALYIDELEKMLSESDKFKLDQQFNNIKIYKARLDTPVKDFTFIASNMPSIGPRYFWNNLDKAFNLFGHYKTDAGNIDYYFPYRSLFTGKNVDQKEFKVLETDGSFTFIADLPKNLPENLVLPDPSSDKLTFVEPVNLSEFAYLLPEVRSDGNRIETLLPKVGGRYTTSLNPANDPITNKSMKCAEFETDEGGFIQYTKPLEDNRGLRLISNQNGRCRISFWIQHASHQNGYLVSVNSRHIKGRSIYMWIENVNIKRPEIEAYLPADEEYKKSYFILPPLEISGLSYTLHFDNVAVGNNEAINELSDITITPIPYYYLTSTYFENGRSVNKSFNSNYTVKHPNPATYVLEVENSNKGDTLVLSQSFDKGWVALSLKNHQLINNWANGWVIEKEGRQKILIFYAPQILEFLGFFLILIFSFYIFVRWHISR